MSESTRRKKIVQITISPTKLCGNHEKIYQNAKLKEIDEAINGLFNSGGGVLNLRYENSPPNGHVRKCFRKIEQKLIEFLGAITVAYDIHAVVDTKAQEIKINVKTSTKTDNISTIKSNLYFPSNEQITEVSPTEHPEKIKKILRRNGPFVKRIEPHSRHSQFRKSDFLSFSESKEVQFKCLSDKKLEKGRSSFGTRLVGKGTKLRCHVSAFANYAGGHLYIGIEDNGKVRGEKLDEEEKEKVRVLIRKEIEKMIWPKESESKDANKEKRYEVFFEPVKDTSNNDIPSEYVVVVFVPQCPGGVFVEEPECYEITAKNEVQKMSFATWKKRFDPYLAQEEECRTNVTQDMAVHEILTCMLNNNCSGDELITASEEVMTKHKSSNFNVELICLSKRVSFYLRKGNNIMAEKIRREYQEIVSKCPNDKFKLMEQYHFCITARYNNNYQESYEIAKKCLHDVNEHTPCIISALFYIQMATLENILAMKTKDPNEMFTLTSKAKENYAIAERHLNDIQGCESTKIDYRQKIYINKALLYLGSSLTGDMLSDDMLSYHKLISIKEARTCLQETQNLVHQGYPLREFRKIQNLFAEASLCYRLRSEEPRRQTELLEHAVRYAKEAKCLAKKNELVEMKTFAKNFVKFFKSKRSMNTNSLTE